MSQDEAVRATNDDAASCKRSAVQLGYWSDPYLQYFVKSADRKPPEINRGYYTRVMAIQQLIRQCIDLTGPGQCQVVNLGAGYDTQFWTLADAGQSPRVWVDMDFDTVTAAKIHYIRSRKQLTEKLSEPQYTRTELHSSSYHIAPCDLRHPADVLTRLESCGVDLSQPTAFIAECVLVYMPAADSSALLRALADAFQAALFICYEQVNMGDKFGQVMVDNLKSRGCALSGVEHCHALDTQRARFLSTGWENSEAMHMMDVYRTLPQADIHRIESIEMLDDYDTLVQLFEHYCVVWATIDRRHSHSNGEGASSTLPSARLSSIALTQQ